MGESTHVSDSGRVVLHSFSTMHGPRHVEKTRTRRFGCLIHS